MRNIKSDFVVLPHFECEKETKKASKYILTSLYRIDTVVIPTSAQQRAIISIGHKETRCYYVIFIKFTTYAESKDEILTRRRL